MKKNLLSLAAATVGVVAALGFTSCAYDPYYSSTSIGYNSGYGHGYGYGGSSFSTSVFIGTGDPRWGYDPYTYSYYDYHRHCYYDPYLNGYYPIGYRPAVVYGVPHPYGWRPGHGYIHPPHHISDARLSDYHNREDAYRNSNYGWAKQVRQRPVEEGRVQGQRPTQGAYDRTSSNRYQSGARPSGTSYREAQPRYQQSQPARNSYRSATSEESRGSTPSRYKTTVTSASRQKQDSPKYQQAVRNESSQKPQKNSGYTKEKQSEEDKNRVRGYR